MPFLLLKLNYTQFIHCIFLISLFHLAATLEPGALIALFRASHLSVLYKSRFAERPGLFALVTDQIFAQEPSVVRSQNSIFLFPQDFEI